MRSTLTAIFVLLATATHAQVILDTPQKYERAVSNVSNVLLVGLWYRKCLGDPNNEEVTRRLNVAFKFINTATASDETRSKVLLEAALTDAARFFSRRVQCNETDRQVAIGLADNSISYMLETLK